MAGFTILFLIFQILPPGITYAAEEDALGKVIGCTWQNFVSLNCVGYYLAIGGFYFLRISGYLLSLAGSVFDQFSLLSLRTSSYTNIPAVYKGWALSRDVANLFFIFIILIIAIATILQISGYGARQLLLRVIAVALFINFSLLVTQQIIIASNSLAITFYKAVSPPSNPTTPGALSLSALIAEKLNPQLILTAIYGSDWTQDQIAKAKQAHDEKLGKLADEGLINDVLGVKVAWNWWKDKLGFTDVNISAIISILISTFGGIILILLATFVLLAAAILFLLRTIVLWVLMILAPLAFLFEVLPKTRGFAGTWWKKLFDQAFFAPAFMFMFYIAISIINSGFMEENFFQLENKGLTDEGGVSIAFQMGFIAQFVLIAALMLLPEESQGAPPLRSQKR